MMRTDYVASMIDGRTVMEVDPNSRSADEVRQLSYSQRPAGKRISAAPSSPPRCRHSPVTATVRPMGVVLRSPRGLASERGREKCGRTQTPASLSAGIAGPQAVPRGLPCAASRSAAVPPRPSVSRAMTIWAGTTWVMMSIRKVAELARMVDLKPLLAGSVLDHNAAAEHAVDTSVGHELIVEDAVELIARR